MKIRSLGTCVLTALLCACASTSVKTTWKSPEHTGGPLTKVAVLTIDQRIMLREGFENRLATQIRKGGASAATTFNLLSLPEINQDKPAAAERFRSAGADAIVILRLVDVASSYRESRPGRERYTEFVSGYEVGTWYDYYTVAFGDMSPTYGNLKQKVYLEASVFDLKTAKRLWAGLTETVVTERMDRLAEMDPLVAKVVGAMRKDAIIP